MGGTRNEFTYPNDPKGEFQRQHEPGTYALVDVRQPEEYEQHHLPGAILLPLPERQGLFAAVDRFTGGAVLQDDATLLVVERLTHT